MTMTIEYALLGITQLNSMKWENHNIKWIAQSIMTPDNDILQTMKHRLQMDHWEIKLSRIPFMRALETCDYPSYRGRCQVGACMATNDGNGHRDNWFDSLLFQVNNTTRRKMKKQWSCSSTPFGQCYLMV